MGSAASPLRFSALLLPFDRGRAARALGLGAAAAVLADARLAHLAALPALAALLSLWMWHVELARAGRVAPLLGLAILVWQLRSAPGVLDDPSALGGGLFVYLVVWVIACYDREPGLQSMASAALLLSAGVLAKPAIALSCAVLSVALFAIHVRSAVHRIGFGLLLFTPALLCALSALALTLLNTPSMHAAGIAHSHAAAPGDGALWRYLPVFPTFVIAYRLARLRFKGPDFAYLAMLATGAIICRTEWPPGALTLNDLFFFAAGGAAALMAASRNPETAV